MSQSWPASTAANPRTSRKNTRSAAASVLHTITWAPKIMRMLLSPRSGGEKLPVPLGDDFDAAVGHFDGGLIVHGVRRHRHAGGPFFRVGHGVVRHRRGIQGRKHRKLDEAQGL